MVLSFGGVRAGALAAEGGGCDSDPPDGSSENPSIQAGDRWLERTGQARIKSGTSLGQWLLESGVGWSQQAGWGGVLRSAEGGGTIRIHQRGLSENPSI